MTAQYFRQCIQHPPPLTPLQQQQHETSPQSASQQAATLRRPTASSSTTPNTLQSHFHVPRCTADEVQTSDRPSSTPDARHLPSFSHDRSKQVGTDSVMARSLSEPLNESKQHQTRGLPVRNAADNDRGRSGGLDRPSPDFIHAQKTIDNAEELPSPGDWKAGSRESVESGGVDLVYEWTTSGDSCRDSGCMSDLSSGGGNSPAATVSPQSVINDVTTSDHVVSDDDYALTKHLGEIELQYKVHDVQQQATRGSSSVQPGLLAPVTSLPARSWPVPSVPRYVRPIREIPPRFQRLLAAEVERVVRLCQRLNGSPLYSAATPTNSVRQTTTCDGREAQSITSQAACVIDRPERAGQSAYTAGHSPLIYVTAQSSGLPVYPPPASGISVNASTTVEQTSYVLPVGMPADVPPVHEEGPAPPLPMFVASPVFFYDPAATLAPPPDVEAALFVVPVGGGCPQPGAGTAQEPTTHSQSNPAAYASKSTQSETAVVSVFQSAQNDACSTHPNGFYYSPPPCADLQPRPNCCPLQMMQA